MNYFAGGKLREHLLDATERSFVECRSRLGDTIYGFFLILDPLGTSVSAMCQNEERLVQFANSESMSWSSVTGDTKSLVSVLMRWTCDGWLMCDSAFDQANRLIEEWYADDTVKYSENGAARFVFLSCLTALAELDSMGFFGRGTQRAQLVLSLFVGDQSNEELCSWAIRVNPYDVYARFKSELHDANEAYKALTFIGRK